MTVKLTQGTTVRHIVGPTILLFSGNYFDFLDPEHSIFTIEDVAQGLSLACRFAGQCKQHYSVAQHSVHLSDLLPAQYRYAGLMHDAAEAFIGDVSRPLKDLLPEYRAIEERVEKAVFAHFGVVHPIPDIVKEFDIVMLETEQRQLMRNRDDWDYTRGRQCANIVIPNISNEQARELFLDRYRHLASPHSHGAR